MGYVHMIADAPSGQKRTLDALDLELQRLVSFPIQVLGTELGSSSRAICSLNG